MKTLGCRRGRSGATWLPGFCTHQRPDAWISRHPPECKMAGFFWSGLMGTGDGSSGRGATIAPEMPLLLLRRWRRRYPFALPVGQGVLAEFMRLRAALLRLTVARHAGA